jgi:hypothetical protein
MTRLGRSHVKIGHREIGMAMLWVALVLMVFK